MKTSAMANPSPEGSIPVEAVSGRDPVNQDLASNSAIPADASPIRISVIIPALNEAEMIGQCLDCLAGSNFPRNAFEVIVVDNGSTDRTVEIAQSYSRQLRITVLQEPGVNISALRNLGAGAAKGEILAFLDADCLVPADWLENADQNLRTDSEGIIGGNIAIPEESRWVARTWYGVGYAPKDGEVTYVPSGNMLMRRAPFLRMGGFDKSLQTSEDDDLCLRAHAAGLPVRAVAKMAVVHLRTPQTLREFYRRERWHGMHASRMFLGNIKARANFRAVAFACFMLAGSVALLSGLGLVFVSGRFVLLAAASAIMMAASLALSVRKLYAVRGRSFWFTLLPLTTLHVVYGLARARALLSLGCGYPRGTPPNVEGTPAAAASSNVAARDDVSDLPNG